MLPGLHTAECTETTTASGLNKPEAAFLELPAGPGVVVLCGAAPEKRPLLIAATADTRAFARRKLLPGLASVPEAGRPRVDMATVVESLRVYPAGSSLEAEAIYLAQARMHMPSTHAVVSERWRPWFVQIDPEAEFPQWTKTNLVRLGSVLPRSASTPVAAAPTRTSRLIGPFADKDIAGKVIEQVIDAFDLCRFHHLLQQAPTATACVYKEMGRCPAPCDGTESMSNYRERTRLAADALCVGLGACVESLEARLREVAAAMDFESAAAIQHKIKRVSALTRPALGHLAELATWSVLFVLPHARSDMARVVLLSGPRLGVVGDLPRKADLAEATLLATAAIAHSRSPAPFDGSSEQIDAISVASRWLFLPATKKRGLAIRLLTDMLASDLAANIQKAARAMAKTRPGPVVGEQEVDILT